MTFIEIAWIMLLITMAGLLVAFGAVGYDIIRKNRNAIRRANNPPEKAPPLTRINGWG